MAFKSLKITRAYNGAASFPFDGDHVVAAYADRTGNEDLTVQYPDNPDYIMARAVTSILLNHPQVTEALQAMTDQNDRKLLIADLASVITYGRDIYSNEEFRHSWLQRQINRFFNAKIVKAFLLKISSD